MKVAVVGTLLWDTIHSWNGLSREGPGGIAYNCAALASVLGPEDEVIPVCWLGSEHLERLKRNWKDLTPPVDLGHVRASRAGSDTNDLTYDSPMRCREVMTLRCSAVSEAMIEGVRDADLIHFNAITGKEFDLHTIRSAAERLSGILMLDVHCLPCRLSREGNLTRARWGSWREWAELFDIVQCNEEELALMVGVVESGLSGVAAAAREVLLEGPHCVVVTLAARGSMVGWRHGGRDWFWHTPALTPSIMADPTGCGDCYSAGFICDYLRSHDPREAAILATAAATMNCETLGTGAFNTPMAERSMRDCLAAEADRLRRAQRVVEPAH